ncbi:hypothetical protein [Rhodopseudomonas sp.]|uniref:hypothetical protein n=1 Tax=Rhodopseudomonas sp. TaxID=1078 RepID=UPI003B3AD823
MQHDLAPKTDELTYLIELAEVLDDADETTLGPTDSHLAAEALRLQASYLVSLTP